MLFLPGVWQHIFLMATKLSSYEPDITGYVIHWPPGSGSVVQDYRSADPKELFTREGSSNNEQKVNKSTMFLSIIILPLLCPALWRSQARCHSCPPRTLAPGRTWGEDLWPRARQSSRNHGTRHTAVLSRAPGTWGWLACTTEECLVLVWFGFRFGLACATLRTRVDSRQSPACGTRFGLACTTWQISDLL